MPIHANLRGEDVPHHAFLIYDVHHPSRKQTECVWHPIQHPHLSPSSLSRVKGRSSLSAKFLCHSTGSELIPITSACGLLNPSKPFLKARTSLAQLDVCCVDCRYNEGHPNPKRNVSRMAQAQHTPTLASLHSRECCHACRHPYLVLGRNRRPIRWQRSQPRRLTPGQPPAPLSLEPYLLPNYDVVSRRTNAGSELYDVSVHGVVFDRGILGVWPVRTSRVGDTDPDLISISAEGVVTNVGVASVVYRDTAAHSVKTVVLDDVTPSVEFGAGAFSTLKSYARPAVVRQNVFIHVEAPYAGILHKHVAPEAMSNVVMHVIAPGLVLIYPLHPRAGRAKGCRFGGVPVDLVVENVTTSVCDTGRPVVVNVVELNQGVIVARAGSYGRTATSPAFVVGAGDIEPRNSVVAPQGYKALEGGPVYELRGGVGVGSRSNLRHRTNSAPKLVSWLQDDQGVDAVGGVRSELESRRYGSRIGVHNLGNVRARWDVNHAGGCLNLGEGEGDYCQARHKDRPDYECQVFLHGPSSMQVD